jgi:hypothetical protein
MKAALLTFTALVLSSCFSGTTRAQTIVTDSTSRAETTVNSPPPSAISPSITVINSKNCSTGVAGAAQTQVLGISFGVTVRDENCEMIIKSESLSGQGMKAAGVALLCQDAAVWWSMWDSGIYCPIDGKINQEAKKLWEEKYVELIPKRPKIK